MSIGPGSRLDAYELLQPLGAGGMGEVWLATEVRLGRKVALKFLPSELTSDPARVSRFEQEAKAASALSHPNVCTIHALGETSEGQHYIAMEYVEGETLRRRIAAGRLNIRESLDIAIQIASALVVAHAHGIVHRDIKPENVIVRPDGFVKVLDFGLAKLTAAKDSVALEATHTAFRTDAGTAVGTVAYMSPEQARGQQVDARTDVWSLGVVLYEMVAGRRPFTGASTSDLIAGILEHEPEPLTRFDPDVPQELQRVIGKALRKDVERRYQSSKDLLLDLETLRDDLASKVSVVVAPAASVSKVRTRRGVLIGLGLLLLALGAGAVWMRSVNSERATGNRDASAPAHRSLTRLTFNSGLQTDATFSPDGRFIAYASDHAGSFDIWIQTVSGGEARQVTRSPSQETQPSWSPDGRSIVFRSERDGGGLFIVPVDGGAERHISSFGTHPQWSADGAEILFRSGYGDNITNAYVVSAHGGQQPHELLPGFLSRGAWSWIAPHPDGRISAVGIHPERRFGFFTVSRDGADIVSSTIVPDLPLQSTEQGTRLLTFQWDPSGTALYLEAIVNQVRNIWKVSVAPETLAWFAAERLTTGTGSDAAATLSSSGTRMAFTTQQESVRLWAFPFDAASGRIELPGKAITPESGGVQGFALSPDGRFVAYVLRRIGSDRMDLWLTDIAEGASELFGAHALPGAWSPDSRTFAYALTRPGRPPPGEWALAVREVGGPERIVGPWSGESVLLPTDWTRDGRGILGSYLAPLFTGVAKLTVRSISPAAGPASDRILIADPQRAVFQGMFSPNGQWLSFVANPLGGRAQLGIAIAPAAGAPSDQWIRVAPHHGWADKPRWAPDGRTLYFISREQSSFFNLWGARFDPDAGRVIGDPFMITNFDSPALMVSTSEISELGISARHAMLTMVTVTGNIWMLDNVDK